MNRKLKKTTAVHFLTNHFLTVKGTVMQIEKAPINDHLRISKAS